MRKLSERGGVWVPTIIIIIFLIILFLALGNGE